MKMDKAAIVLLNYNGEALLKKFLAQLIAHSEGHPIYLIDNGSTDASLTWLEAHNSEVKPIALSRNLGYAGGYNEGLKQIEAEIYILLNTDVWVTQNWIAPMLEHFEQHPNTAIAQPHILDYSRQTYFEYAGAAGGYLDQFGFPYCRGRLMNALEEDRGQYDQETAVFWASGACFFVRKAVFESLGGFDPDFFAHQEEIDLCWRAHRKGYEVFALGTSKVYHLGGGTLKLSAQKVFLNHRNSLFMLLKNLPSEGLALLLFKRLLLDGLAGINYFICGKWSYTLAIVRAHIAFYKKRSAFQNKRHEFIPKHPYFKHKSIIKAYFFKGIRNFNQLNP